MLFLSKLSKNIRRCRVQLSRNPKFNSIKELILTRGINVNNISTLPVFAYTYNIAYRINQFDLAKEHTLPVDDFVNPLRIATCVTLVKLMPYLSATAFLFNPTYR